MKTKNIIIGALAACWGVTALAAAIFFGCAVFEHQRAEHPPVPVSVRYRKALTGDGDVVRICNHSGKMLPVQLTLSNQTFNRTKTYNFVLSDGEIKEVGYLEGWTGAPGDKIELTSQDYSPFLGEIPKRL